MKNKLLFPCLLLLALASQPSRAQIQHGGTAPGLRYSLAAEPRWQALPEGPYAQMLEQDLAAERQGERSMRFALEHPLELEPGQAGSLTRLPDGSTLWRLGIRSAGAFSLGLEFSLFELEPGAEVFLTSLGDGGGQTLGALTHQNNKPWKSLSTTHLPGDSLLLEAWWPAGLAPQGLRVGQAFHAYRDIFGTAGKSSGACHININCPGTGAMAEQQHSVCRLLIQGTRLCTGALLNNARRDGTPYLLTANHCVSQANQAQNTVFLFNYQTPECEWNGAIDQSQTVSGADLRATIFLQDFALLEISEQVPLEYQPYFSGWTRSEEPSQPLYGVHHPSGDVKKFNQANVSPTITTWPGQTEYEEDTHWHVNVWFLGATEPGSSGSPLFDAEGRVIGDLTGGASECGNAVNDYYAMFSKAWDTYGTPELRLQPWLDPDETGITQLDGMSGNAVGLPDDPQQGLAPSVFPNPTDGPIEFRASAPATWTLTDLSGKVLATWTGSQGQADLSHLAPGLYLLRASSPEGNAVLKLIRR